MLALALLPSLGFVARAPGRCPAARMGSRLDGMVLGEAVSPEVLQQLGIEGKRAVVAFFCRDNGFECMQELRDLESRANRYQTEFSCDIVAIRSRGSWLSEDTPSKYPAIRFMVDEGEELRQAFRMEIGQINDRQSYLLDAEGRVQGQINMYQDPYAHSAMATRTLLAMDNAADPWNAAANPAAVEEKATQMKAYYREEMDEKLAKQKAFDERKSAEKSAEKSAPSEPARDLRYEDTGGDFNVFERLGGLFSAGLKKGDEE